MRFDNNKFLFSNVEIVDVQTKGELSRIELSDTHPGWVSFDGKNRNDIFALLDSCILGRLNILFHPLSVSGIRKNLIAHLNDVYPNKYGYVAFLTSGSTGKLKVIVHRISTLIKAAGKISEKYPSIIGGSTYAAFPNNYMAGVLNNLLVPLVSSSRIVLDKAFDFTTAFRLPKIFNEYSVTWSWMNPQMISALTRLHSRSQKLECTSLILSATSSLSPTLRNRAMQSLNTPILNTYGLTELLFVSGEEKPDTDVYIGTPFNGVQIELKGEVISIKTDTKYEVLMEIDLYGNQLSLENSSEGKDEYLTNDLGLISPKGIVFLGRSDDIVKIKGYLVSLSLIESVSNTYPNVVDSCVQILSRSGRETIKLFVEVEDVLNFNFNDFEVFLAEKLPEGSQPNRVLGMKLPRLYSGKVDRGAIRSGDWKGD